ncbi:MAG: F0F1 ATP synthase subunit gamma [Gammaproteobacteria bacterium]
MMTREALEHSIGAVREVQSIVRTMKALAAVSVYPAERAVDSMSNYSRTIELGLHVVLSKMSPPGPGATKESKDIGIIVLGSDHGLCGRFNEDIVEFALAWSAQEGLAIEDRHVLALGARVESRLREAGQPVMNWLPMPGSVAGIKGVVDAVMHQLVAWQDHHAVSRVVLFLNRQAGGQGRVADAIPLLPLDLERLHRGDSWKWPSRSLPAFTLPREELFAALVRQYLFSRVFRACARSLASEHASRLAAMQAAERNIADQLQELTTNFNRVRQESITNELLEVVSGFEVLTAP